MSNPWDILILGCGRLGGNLKTELESKKFRVLGVRRSQIEHDAAFLSLDLDLSESWNRLANLPLSENAVIVAIVTPDARTEVHIVGDMSGYVNKAKILCFVTRSRIL